MTIINNCSHQITPDVRKFINKINEVDNEEINVMITNDFLRINQFETWDDFTNGSSKNLDDDMTLQITIKAPIEWLEKRHNSLIEKGFHNGLDQLIVVYPLQCSLNNEDLDIKIKYNMIKEKGELILNLMIKEI